MIPDLIDTGSLWSMLPPGIHTATFQEIEGRFATSIHRKQLFQGFVSGVASLQAVGCTTIYLDGSFVTGKPYPGDYDVCWGVAGVNDKKIDPVFLDFDNGRANQKKKFLGEYFPSHFIADPKSRLTFLEYFQLDSNTGAAKGIIRLI